MLEDKISELLDFISETNLVEEYFYEHKGVYPVYSGQTENKGIVSHIDTYKQNEDCVTTTTYGNNAGHLFFRTGKYTIGRNCLGIKPKPEYANQINMEWFSYKFQNLFYRLRIGDPHGQRSLNQFLIENVIIKIPSSTIQTSELCIYIKSQTIFDTITKIENEISELLESKSKELVPIFSEPLKKIFKIHSGTNGLTKKFIYENQITDIDDKIPILSSATLQSNTMGFISKNAKCEDGSKIKIFTSPAILVARNGFAGTMNFVYHDCFTANDHAYVLILKEKWKTRVNLRWFSFQYQELFRNLVTSKSDNATFNKKYAEKQIIQISEIDFQDKIAEKLQILDTLKIKLGNIKKNTHDLIEYEITQ